MSCARKRCGWTARRLDGSDLSSQGLALTALPPIKLRLGAAEYGLIALQSMLWGSAFFFIAVARDSLPPITMSALRLVPACAIVLVAVALTKQRLPATLAEWGLVVIHSLFNSVVPFIIIIYAQRSVSGGTAAIFNATAPLFTIFLAAYFIADETLSWRRVIGILIGIAGVGILVGGGVSGGGDGILARVGLVAAAACYAIGNVYARLFMRGYAPFTLACAQMIASLVIASLLAVIVEQPWTAPLPSLNGFLAIMGMGAFGSGFASLCHFTVLRRAGATNAMLVTIILPLTPIFLGALFLGERLSPREIIGALVIASALVYIDGRLFEWVRRRLGGNTTGRGTS